MTAATERAREARAKLAWPFVGPAGVSFVVDEDFRDFHGAPCLRYEVPGPPVPKGRPRFNPRSGRAYTPEKTRAYEKIARHAAEFEVARSKWPSGGFEGACVRYFVQIDLWLAADRGDADNFAKSIIDAANGVVFPDDAKVCGKLITRRIAHGMIEPCARVAVTAMGVAS